MASPAASLLSSPVLSSPAVRAAVPATTLTSNPCCGYTTHASTPSSAFILGVAKAQVLQYPRKNGFRRIVRKVSTIEAPATEKTQECSLPTWAEFDIGKAPIFWKTMNGLPPTSGEMLTLFYNPAASNLVPNEDFGIAFNGGFNQPIMCGGEPRVMTAKIRGKADPTFYTIKICIPKHAVNIIFSFTNGTDWDGPYRLQFQVLKKWRNKPLSFFNEGLAEELSKEGACEKAIFPDSYAVITRCQMIGNLSAEGGDRCNLDLVPGCTDPSSPYFNPLANFDDGSCPLDLESEEA